ncbi:MAG: PLP-dependent aminotransferase family protein [Allosphingosinicella sp.]|uniref:aminotransferase-like domain-containing protein n=1 Tax=Allosphingosinicella sp. TaxID=2823234 RepID=UPI003936FD92
MNWEPILADGSTPVYERLADAIERDVASGALRAGARLPPHRDLAVRLGLGVGTVSKAYSEAERRGLVRGHVGRGSFVTARRGAQGTAALVDFARNVPPAAPAADRLGEALAALRGRPDLAEAATYSQVEGLPRTRAAGAAWLRGRCGVYGATAERLIQCNGGQHGLGIALAAAGRPGDGVMCDAATFFGMRMLADHAGYRLHAVAMDAGGMIPDSVEDVARRTGARILYVMPTLQNPTTRTLSEARRHEIARLAERLGLVLIEDDVYRPYALDAPGLPTFADLLPDRTYHVASVSKSISPGLRVGFILPPRDRHTAVARAAQAAGWSPATLGGMIFAEWVEDGTADGILRDIVAEVRWRTETAAKILGDAVERPAFAASPHVWLPLPVLDAERAAGRALRAGVQVTPVDASLVDAHLASGIRLCIAAAEAEDVVRGLEVVRDALHEEIAGRSIAFV